MDYRRSKNGRGDLHPWARFLFLCSMLTSVSLALWTIDTPVPAARAAPKTWPTTSLQQHVTGLTQPVYVTHAGDASGRMFIVERAGKIRIFKNNSLNATDFLSITGRVRINGWEEGLLSVAFPPNYGSKGWFYVYYTDLNGSLQISRFRRTANPDVADPNSEQSILNVQHPSADNHNGGQLQFGIDGFLYLATGDGAVTPTNAQSGDSLLGKILRLNVEPAYNPNPPAPLILFTPAYTFYLPLITAVITPPISYTIPLTNPFTATVGYRDEIWALGLRNPWRLSFDRSNGDFYVADVGQNTVEEVDFQPYTQTLAMNYGWPTLEGPNCYSPSVGCVPPLNYSPPITYYLHTFNESNGNPGCSTITGGYVYRGSTYPAMQGIYFYGDYCSGRLFGAQKSGAVWTTTQFTDTTYWISTFGEDESGELYLANYVTGIVYRIIIP